MIYQAKWKCPALCGCELLINADWVHDSVQENGETVQYANPKEDTISSIDLVTTCTDHQTFLTEDIPTDIYEYNGQMWTGILKITTQQYVQHMADIGRPLTIPLLDPTMATPAQKLFIRLYGEANGGILKLPTCNCEAYTTSNRFTGEQKHLDHPVQSRNCKYHIDDINHQKAIGEANLHSQVKTLIRQSHPELTKEFVMLGDHEVVLNANSKQVLDTLGLDYSSPTWELVDCALSFNAQRELEITVDATKTAEITNTLKNLQVIVKGK